MAEQTKFRRSFRGRPAAQSDGLRARARASAADPEQLRRTAVRRRPVGRQRQARPFRLHDKRCATAASKLWRCTTFWPRPSRFRKRKSGSSTIRSYRIRSGSAWSTKYAVTSKGLQDRDLAEIADRRPLDRGIPRTHGGEMLNLVRDAAGVTEYLLPPLPNTLYTRDTTCWIYGGVR